MKKNRKSECFIMKQKITNHRFIMLPLLLLFMLFVWGCSQEFKEENIIGTSWELSKQILGGEEKDLGSRRTINFKANGQIVVTVDNKTKKGEYFIVKDEITIDLGYFEVRKKYVVDKFTNSELILHDSDYPNNKLYYEKI